MLLTLKLLHFVRIWHFYNFDLSWLTARWGQSSGRLYTGHVIHASERWQVEMGMCSVSFIRSKYLNESIAVVSSDRSPSSVYRFVHRVDNKYRCCRCKELGKERNITIVDGVIVGRKHPDDDHHAECEPFPEAVAQAQELDRNMRHEVSKFVDSSLEMYWEECVLIANCI